MRSNFCTFKIRKFYVNLNDRMSLKIPILNEESKL